MFTVKNIPLRGYSNSQPLFFGSYLSDTSHRETYEFSHSVVLATFSSHAQHVGENLLDKDHTRNWDDGSANFVDKLVPFYTSCLIEVK